MNASLKSFVGEQFLHEFSGTLLGIKFLKGIILSDESTGFRFLDHMTDAEIEVYGSNLGESFENAGKAVETLMVDLESVRPLELKSVDLAGRDLGSLLYQWIESLIELQEGEGLIFSWFRCGVFKKADGTFNLKAELKGEKFDPSRHEQKTAIKAPTFHDMKITEDKDRVTMRFLVDL